MLKFWNNRTPVFKFLVKTIFFIALFYSFWATQWFHDNIVDFITKVDAKISAVILNIFGAGTQAFGNQIVGNTGSVNVNTGCDGLEAMAIYASGVVSYPTNWLSKLKGVFAGVGFLFALNIVRIINLYWINNNHPNLFDFFHENFWQVIFILMALLCLAWWINALNKNNNSNKEETQPASNQ